LRRPAPELAEGEQWVWVPFVVDKEYDGYRIDRFLSQRLIAYSRSRVQQILEQSRVMKGERLVRPSTKVHTGDKICVAYPRKPEEPLADDAALTILYEDEDLLVIDKPGDLLSHPTDKVVQHTVLGILRHSRPDVPSLHLLHRLDRETSGVLVLAKNPKTARLWTRAMERHEMQKEYLALVRGHLSENDGEISWPIGRQRGDIKVRQWIHVEGAVAAHTRFEVLKRGEARAAGSSEPFQYSFVKAVPRTGRLHQIRVHFSAIGHPLLGDPLYTGRGEVYQKMINRTLVPEDRLALLFPRVALHAAAMSFTHPINQIPVRVESPLPSDMRDFCSQHA
jgi:23S rRNA pseudouridine1911/1915/1917 synthase